MRKSFLKIRTKNHTAQPLKNLIEVNTRTVFRLGSITPTEEIFPRGVALNKPIIEINTADACHNSGDKILMKTLFDQDEVKTAEWKLLISMIDNVDEWNVYPAIIKHKNSCKGEGIYFINSREELVEFIRLNRLSDYII
jgi:biotin carboxylase